MIKFLKERFLAVLFLSVIFTFSSLFWTSDVVYYPNQLNSIDLGWPVDFAVQNYSQLTPPLYWFPNKVGFGLPQEYPVHINLLSLFINISFSFVVMFLLTFAILKTYPNSKVLSELTKARYIAGFVVSISVLFILYMIFSSNINQLRRGVGVSPPMIEKPIPQVIGYNKDTPPNELSAIEEVMYRFDQNNNIPTYAVFNKSSLRWNDDDGYSILVPTTKTLSIHKSEEGCLDRDVVPNIFSEELAASKDVFEKRGFVLNNNNSSVDVSDDRLYDYVQAYVKDGEMCRITVNTDCMSYKGSGFNIAHGIYISCGNGLEEARAKQIPFLKALELKNKKAVVRIQNQAGEFFQVGFNFQRTGSTAVLKKEGDSYRVLFIGQEAPSCELIEKEGIPDEVLSSVGKGSCWESNGEYRRKNEIIK